MVLSDESKEALKSLGGRLRSERLARNETQKIFAARLTITVPTLLKMERGDPSVKIGLWVDALDLLNRLSDLDRILAAPEDLFVKYEQMCKTAVRKRASRRKLKSY